MDTVFSQPVKPAVRRDPETGHRIRWALAALAAVALMAGVGYYGFEYYRLDRLSRIDHALHQQLRSSGTVGLRLGMLGFAMYCVLFAYPIRKRWRRLAYLGNTKHWLDFHAILGITAPVLITYHAAFQFRGLAGIAYWIMVAVALSGFVGRYIYAQIPRSMHAAELTASELDAQVAELTAELSRQALLTGRDLAPLLRVPTPDAVRQMPLVRALWTMLRLDLSRPFLVAALRRRLLRGVSLVTTLGGLLASGNRQLEGTIAIVRKQSTLRTKLAFLERIRQVFHLWHVVHRPFSYSFAVLVTIHLAVVIMLGYF